MNLVVTRSHAALVAAGLLLVANVVFPLVCGDVYPFTSAPMFRDSPANYCSYKVFGPDGKQLPLEDWQLQRVYDGNPIGYGVGVRPPAVLEQEFGRVHDEATVRDHVARRFEHSQNRDFEFVEVVQESIGLRDAQRVGVVSTQRWRIDR